MVMKLQEKLYLKNVTSRLNNIDESFKQSMGSFITSEKNSLSKALGSFAREPLNVSGINHSLPSIFTCDYSW